MSERADLIAFYTYSDGEIFNQGHGVIGTAYSDLYLHHTFQENYIEIAAIDYKWVITRWFIHKDSAFIESVDQALAPIRMENPPAIKP